MTWRDFYSSARQRVYRTYIDSSKRTPRLIWLVYDYLIRDFYGVVGLFIIIAINTKPLRSKKSFA